MKPSIFTRDFWIDAAYSLACQGGVSAVKVLALARQLGVSRSNFYRHFGSQSALLEVVGERWRATEDARIRHLDDIRCGHARTDVRRVIDHFLIGDPTFASDYGLERSIRVFPEGQESLTRQVAAVDAARVDLLKRCLEPLGNGSDPSGTLAQCLYLSLLGAVAGLHSGSLTRAEMARLSSAMVDSLMSVRRVDVDRRMAA